MTREYNRKNKFINDFLCDLNAVTKEAILSKMRELAVDPHLPPGWMDRETVDLCIYSNNCRGFNSKQESFQENVVEALRPDVINLEETLLRNKAQIKIKDYISFSLNRPDGAGGGGISTSVAEYLKPFVTMVSKDNEYDEFMVTRFEHVKPALNIIHIYGQNEGRAGPAKILEGWTRILTEINRIEARNEVALIVGDLNRAVGNDHLGVRGNKPKVRSGGQLIRDLVSTGEYVLMNNLSLTRGGPWTRVCPSDGKLSCLDLALASQALMPFIREMQVDSIREYAPRRVVTKDKRLGLTYADHYPLIIKLEMPRSEIEATTEASWNVNKPGAWEDYEKISDEEAEKIEELADDETMTNEEIMNKVDKIENKMKYKSFGKSKPKSKKKILNESKDTRTEDDCANDLAKRQLDKMEAAILRVQKQNIGRCGKVFKMKDEIAGSKKTKNEAHAVLDFRTKELVVSNSEIKRVTLDYCKEVLKNNEPEEDFKELVEYKEKVHKIRMESNDDDEEVEITEEEFNQTLAKFESIGSNIYFFITRAGHKYKKAIFKLCRRFIRDEEFPDRFQKTVLVQLQMHLDNSRFLHLKEGWPKLCKALTVRGMKEDILDAGARFQIGGCPGQRTQFHLFVIKSMIALKIDFGGGLIINLYDYQKFFDKQSIIDAMNAISRAKVKSKLYRVWYKLNLTRIQVRTGAGMSEEADVGAVTGQGAGGSALVSSLNLDLAVNNVFKGSKDEDYYGRVRIQPLIWCDDILRSAVDANSARIGNIKLDQIRKEKQLEYHPEKSTYIMIGSESFKEKVKQESKESPLFLGSIQVKEKQEDSYLGDVLSSLGLAASAEATLRSREAKIKGSISELKALIEDFRMQSTGGLRSALDLYTSCIRSSLLTNCGTWVEVEESTVKRMDAIQSMYLRAVLKVPMSTPRAALRAATGLLGIKWVIWKENITLILAIKRQEDGGLARMLWEEHFAMGWPGLS